MNFDLSLFKPSELVEREKLDRLMEIGEVTQQYNITMTEERAKYLLDSSKSALKDTARLEFDEPAVEKIARKFCKSPYATDYNFEKVVETVLDIFYYTKNVIEDYMSDDELLDYIYNAFNEVYHGSLTALPDCVEPLFHKCNLDDYLDEMGISRTADDDEDDDYDDDDYDYEEDDEEEDDE